VPNKTLEQLAVELLEIQNALNNAKRQDPSQVNSAIRQLLNFKDDFTLRNVNWNRRRIVNASPSVDLYDYVVRKELIDTVGESKTPRRLVGSSVVAANYDKITFGIGVGSPAIAGDYVTPPYVWTNTRQGRPAYAVILANTPPTGADFRFLLKKNDASIMLNPYVSLPAGTAARDKILFVDELIPTLFTLGDVVTPHVLQIGSIQPGQDITIVVRCNLL